jgi:putative endonuclease
MSADPRHHLGQLGETLAAEHLTRLGYSVVTRNHRTRFGELDIVAFGQETLVFCEVKTRRGNGEPWDGLDERKRAQVRRMAAAYLAETNDRPRAENVRFDAIGIVIDSAGRLGRLEHLEGAF